MASASGRWREHYRNLPQDKAPTETTRFIHTVPGGPTFFADSDATLDVDLPDRYGRQMLRYRARNGNRPFTMTTDHLNGHYDYHNTGILRPPPLPAGPYFDYAPWYQQVMESDVLMGRRGIRGNLDRGAEDGNRVCDFDRGLWLSGTPDELPDPTLWDRVGMAWDATTPAEAALELTHLGLDVIGMVPVIGVPADLLNAGIYGIEGRYVEAGFSAFAAIPGLGYLAAGGQTAKYMYKAARVADIAINLTESKEKDRHDSDLEYWFFRIFSGCWGEAGVRSPTSTGASSLFSDGTEKRHRYLQHHRPLVAAQPRHVFRQSERSDNALCGKVSGLPCYPVCGFVRN